MKSKTRGHKSSAIITTGKRLIIAVAFIATAFSKKSLAQDSIKITTSYLLHSYYDIKNALVSGSANTTSIKAKEFVKNLNSITTESIEDAVRIALLKDAGDISEAKNIKRQREVFAGFSNNMYAFVKAAKPVTEPVYYAYCPMKKAHWLSNESAIRNPYFGNSMLTCGKVEETLK